VLAAVGLESVDADLIDEVAPLLGPPSRGALVGQVGHEAKREPPSAVPVRAEAAVGAGLADQHPVADGCRGILSHLPRGVRPHLDQRDLPEVQPDAAPVQLVGHALRVGPGAIGRKFEIGEALRLGAVPHGRPRVPPGREGALVAPGLDDDRADRDAVVAMCIDLPHDLGLRVPLVAARPEPEDPVRQLLGTATPRALGIGQEAREHLAR
jgi:hypothetical protein